LRICNARGLRKSTLVLRSNNLEQGVTRVALEITLLQVSSNTIQNQVEIICFGADDRVSMHVPMRKNGRKLLVKGGGARRPFAPGNGQEAMSVDDELAAAEVADAVDEELAAERTEVATAVDEELAAERTEVATAVDEELAAERTEVATAVDEELAAE
jgi:hypothetical protein